MIRELFDNDNSLKDRDHAKKVLVHNPSLIPELVSLIQSGEEFVSRKAIWALDSLLEDYPSLVHPSVYNLIDGLEKYQHDAFRRHILRILNNIGNVPEEKEGYLVDFCFRMLHGDRPAAVKLHAMHILYKYTQEYPELRAEFISAIELAVTEGTVGVKNIGRKLLTKIYRQS